jgi:hypothetical protein
MYDTVTPERLWRGPFTQPVASRKAGSGFGFRRIINGQPRMPHSGIDYSADHGTPVVGAKHGRLGPDRQVILTSSSRGGWWRSTTAWGSTRSTSTSTGWR